VGAADCFVVKIFIFTGDNEALGKFAGTSSSEKGSLLYFVAY
jgi:hypothetical protein